jgi:hypothetical protein
MGGEVMNLTVLRGYFSMNIDVNDLRSNDLVLAENGYFYPVSNFPQLNWRFASRPNPLEGIVGIGLTALVTIGVIGVFEFIGDLFSPGNNNQPLTQSMRSYIRERDEEYCNYCGVHAPDGHVDHMISRRNGGPNDPHNLTWACVSCNCSKGALNDYEFIRYLEA